MLNLKLFGCVHKRYSWPQAIVAMIDGEEIKIPYVACLGCGTELLYDLEEMKIGGPLYGQRINRCRIPASTRVEAGESVQPLSLVRS
jgi:hypothetical protein